MSRAPPNLDPRSYEVPGSTVTRRLTKCSPGLKLGLLRVFACLSALILLTDLVHGRSLSSQAKPVAPRIMDSRSCGPGNGPPKVDNSSYSTNSGSSHDTSSTASNNGSDSTEGHKNGAISATYFVNWAIYARHFFPWEVPIDSVTHVLYAFANVRPESGEVYLTDTWADEQIHWADKGDSWNDQGNNLYGCFNQFRQLKKKNRHLKLLISIGGWTYSANFASGTDSEDKRQKFVDSAIDIVENYGLDGLDVDWEYPIDDRQADQLVDVLRRARAGLNKLQRKKNDQNPYLLTIAAPCGPNHYKQLHLKEMNRYLSFINLMAYDYAGSWDSISGHQANLKLSDTRANQGNFSTVDAVNYYISQSVPPSNLVIGMPLYGRSFLNTQGIGKPYNGLGQGNWEPGIYDYKTIPMENAKFIEDSQVIGAYTYNPSNQELITFDSPNTVRQKVKFIQQRGLGGVMWWESSGDKQNSGDALIPLAAKLLGKLDSTENHLSYPDSKWDNLKKAQYASDTYSNAGIKSLNQPKVHNTSHHKYTIHRKHNLKRTGFKSFSPVEGSY